MGIIPEPPQPPAPKAAEPRPISVPSAIPGLPIIDTRDKAGTNEILDVDDKSDSSKADPRLMPKPAPIPGFIPETYADRKAATTEVFDVDDKSDKPKVELGIEPIDQAAIDEIIRRQQSQGQVVAAPEPILPVQPPIPEPAIQGQTPPAEGYHLGDTVVITPEMKAERDRIKAEVSSNEPTEPITTQLPVEPIPASTPPIAPTEQQAQAPVAPAPAPPVEPTTLPPADLTAPYVATGTEFSGDTTTYIPPMGTETDENNLLARKPAQPQPETPASNKHFWEFWKK